MVDTVLRAALGNALAAAVLALAVAGVALVVRRPALIRALWILVLLKLLVPPFWTIGAIPWEWFPRRADSASARTSLAPAPPMSGEPQPQPLSEGFAPGAETSDAADPATRTPHAPAPTAVLPSPSHFGASGWLAAAWAAGSALYLLTVVGRVRRFNRSMRLATAAPPEVQRRCAALASRLGVHGPATPGVWFLPVTFCPVLWAFARPARVLVPGGLWGRLDEAQRDALLTHELAHLRRGDHWVRLVELAAAVLYWWHPVVWWARRALREAEEQCCDAWVLWALPRCARSYAIALLETIDFISAGSRPAPAAVPALASGMGGFAHLKRRITMIQRGKVTKALSWTTTAALCGVAGLLLPVAPGLGQPSAPPPAQSTPESPPVGAAPAASGATDRGGDADTVDLRPAESATLPPINVTIDAGGPVGVGAPTAGAPAAAPAGIGSASSSASAGGADAAPAALADPSVAAPDTTELPAASAPRAEEVDRLRKEINRLQRRLAELESRGGRTTPARNGARFGERVRMPQTSAQAGPARTPAFTRGQPAPDAGVYSKPAEPLRNGYSGRSRPTADANALDDIERDLQQMLERVRAMKGTPSSAGRQ
jgi:beta-lactamase regulating signal transducer with metallopeptidase domain